MRDSDEILRDIGGLGADCLSPEQLEAVLNGAASEADRKHAAECLHCQTEVAMFKQFVEADALPGEAADLRHIEQKLRQSPPWRQRRSWFAGLFAGSSWSFAAAASLAALLAVGVYFARPARMAEQPPIDSGVMRASASVEGIGPVGDLDRLPTALTWRPVLNAANYEVTLLDIEEKALWTTRLSGATVNLPAAALVQMTNRKTLFWRVAAFDAQGKAIASSAPQRFRLVTPAAH
jgi:hypothetical protein